MQEAIAHRVVARLFRGTPRPVRVFARSIRMGLERAVVSIVRVGDALHVRLARFGCVFLTASSIGARRPPAVVVVPDDQVAPLAAFDIVSSMSLGPQMENYAAHLVAVAECQFSVSARAGVTTKGKASPGEVAVHAHVKCDVRVVGVPVRKSTSESGAAEPKRHKI